MKRKLLILIILICIVGIIVLVAIFLKKNQVVENQAYNAIPEDAALIVDIPDMSKVMPIVSNQENVVWNFELTLQSRQTPFLKISPTMSC